MSIPLCKLRHLRKHFHNVGIAALAVRDKAIAAILYASVDIDEISAAPVPERIQWAIAKQAVEVLRLLRFVARKKLAL